MLLKKVLTSLQVTREFHKELKYLYGRREAIDELIRSLEEYDRYQPRPQLVRRRRSA